MPSTLETIEKATNNYGWTHHEKETAAEWLQNHADFIRKELIRVLNNSKSAKDYMKAVGYTDAEEWINGYTIDMQYLASFIKPLEEKREGTKP